MEAQNNVSAIGWVDFSSEHRDKVKSVVDLLSTPGVIDELGIGVVRDSFSGGLAGVRLGFRFSSAILTGVTCYGPN